MHLPPLPSFVGLHPLLVHYPIALLTLVPLVLLAGLLLRRHAAVLDGVALSMMVLGAAGALAAVATGLAAAGVALKTPEVTPVLMAHAELAEKTRNVFVGLTLLFGGAWLLPLALHRPLNEPRRTALRVVVLLAFVVALPLLVNTAHDGGMLVHQYGLKALLRG